jgi:hypothetical protein
MASPSLIKALAPAIVAFSLLLSGQTLDDSLLAIQETGLTPAAADMMATTTASYVKGMLSQDAGNATFDQDAPIPYDGAAYLYPCYDCDYKATAQVVGFSGATGCNAIPSSGGNIRGVGTIKPSTFGKETTCSLFTDNNCQDQIRKVPLLPLLGQDGKGAVSSKRGPDD